MSPPSAARSVALLVLATTLWGGSSAILAHAGGRFASGAAALALGASLSLLLICRLRNRHISAAARTHWQLFTRLGCLEALNLGLYAGALRLGPLPVMVGLHLTSPVFVVAWLAARGGERIGLVLVKLGLIAGAIVLVASGLEEHHSESSALMGSILALGSALAVAVLIVSVSQRAPEQEPAVGAALQLSVATAVMLPLLALDPPSMLDLGQLAIAGAVLLAPGFVLYWRALRELHAQAAGVIGLNEAVVASLVGFVVYGAAFATRTLLAGVLVCAAVGLELRRSTNLGVTSS